MWSVIAIWSSAGYGDDRQYRTQSRYKKRPTLSAFFFAVAGRLVSDVNLFALGLTNGREGLHEPGRLDIKWLTALDARKLYRAQDIAVVLVMANDAGLAAEGAFDGEICA
jgi:hypothetical protein